MSDQTKAIRALRRKKLTIEQIAVQTGLSKSAVGRAVAGMKTDMRATTNAARGNIEPPWLDEARRLLAGGMSRPKIAIKLNVAQTSVYRMLNKFGITPAITNGE